MPNWCNNLVTIAGRKEDLQLIYEAKLSFKKLCPRPEDQEENWFDWNCENWGTKWDICEDEIDISLDIDENDVCKINANFDTAWCPPTAFFKYLTKEMSGLQVKAKYYEGGMDSCGDVIYENGKMFSWEMDEDEKTQFIRENFNEDYGNEVEWSDDEYDIECDIKISDQCN